MKDYGKLSGRKKVVIGIVSVVLGMFIVIGIPNLLGYKNLWMMLGAIIN